MLLEVLLIRIHHAVEPRQELLRAVVSVEDNRDTISGSDRSDIVGSRDGASYRGLLLVVLDALLSISTRVLESVISNVLTLPAKYAAPPWEAWRMIGEFLSRAASKVATTVEEEVTFCMR